MKRLWFLVLLFLLIFYNSASGFLPDKNIPISIEVQNVIAYSGGVIMSMYFPIYFYKAFNLTKLRFYAYGGSLIFLLLPFIACFLIPYYLTGDLDISRRLVVVVPFFYALSFIWILTKAILERYKDNKHDHYLEEIIGVYLGVIFWISMPIIVYFDGSQLIENSFANAGLLVMTVLFIRSAIFEARSEYSQLLLSKRKLQEMNLDLTIKVKERTQELELANEQKTNTFINLAHETKTPLTLINNYLQEYILKYGVNEDLKVVKTNIEKLTKDIVNFFDIEKINKGLNIYNHNQVSDFSKILIDNMELFKQYARRKNIQLTDSIEKNILVKADPESLVRIVNNLIENAIKYTKENGEIVIKLNSVNGKIIFSVKDNGIGIPTHLHSKIFDPYYQINSEKGNFQGIGLGLSIVKKIADSLCGEVILISEPEKSPGTEVSIRLPKYELIEDTIVSEFDPMDKFHINVEELEAKDEVLDEERPTIMVIEDNISLLNFMTSKLKDKYNIYIATSGNEALEKLKTIGHLDLIVSDVMMDNGGGLDFYRTISVQKRYKHIPIIFITAKNTFEDKMEGLSLGAIDYIFKPFFIDELIRKLDSVLNNLHRQRNAFINAAYKNMMKGNDIEKIIDNGKTNFEESCNAFNLTKREIGIIRLLAKGKSYKEISEELHISDKTVGKHISNIYVKVGVSKTTELLNKLGNTLKVS